MTILFAVCAAVGATVLVLQFLLALAGLGGDSLGFDVPHDLGHDMGGGDHDFAHGDMHGDAHHEDSAAQAESAGAIDHAAGDRAPYGSTWLFQVLSLRTIVAALAFFGLAGLAAESAECTPSTTFVIAIAAGLCAMYAVFFLLRSMRSLRAEGTARVHRAVGRQATVYLHIPAQQKGAGKIQINLQSRTMEYLATTLGDAIPCGATVEVIKVLGDDSVLVQVAASDTLLPAATDHA
jgi:hypothetical protein